MTSADGRRGTQFSVALRQQFPKTLVGKRQPDVRLPIVNLIKVRRERRWTSAGATLARELVRSTR